MKSHTESFLPPFTEAVIIAAVFAFIALFAIPAFQNVYSGSEFLVYGFTLVFFRIGPLLLITVACLLGIGASLGRIWPELRWLSKVSGLLIFLLGVSIAFAMVAPVFTAAPQ